MNRPPVRLDGSHERPTIEELSHLDLHELMYTMQRESWACALAELSGDREATHRHATEAMRHYRAAREHVWRDEQRPVRDDDPVHAQPGEADVEDVAVAEGSGL